MPVEAETTETETTKEAEKKEETRVLTQEDINKLIEAARKQEKSKLCDTIDELKTQVNSLSEQTKKEADEKKRVEEEAAAKADSERQKTLTAEERFTEQLKRLEERMAEEARNTARLKEELDRERAQAELDRYKHQQLEEAGSEVIKELVRGSSKEEIDHTVALAKNKYQEVFQAALKQAEGNTKEPANKLGDVSKNMPKPGAPDDGEQDQVDLGGYVNRGPETGVKAKRSRDDILKSKTSGIDPEYLKNRDKILNSVGKAYNG